MHRNLHLGSDHATKGIPNQDSNPMPQAKSKPWLTAGPGWLQFVYKNALRLEQDQRVQHLLPNEPEQQQLALARENRLMEEENLVNM